MMVDIEHVQQFEHMKQDILNLFHDQLQSHVLSKNAREIRALFTRIALWIGHEKPASEIVKTIKEEKRFASAVQRALLDQQKVLLIRLRDELSKGIALLNESDLDFDELYHSQALAEINALVELVLIKSKEIVAVPKGRRA